MKEKLICMREKVKKKGKIKGGIKRIGSKENMRGEIMKKEA